MFIISKALIPKAAEVQEMVGIVNGWERHSQGEAKAEAQDAGLLAECQNPNPGENLKDLAEH